ncbi:MAG: M56 family metallopeptidase [Planctomycetota bacterium]|jgi:beta-lactamase regulating signal transducer with metallopeptidase domain
MNQAINTCITGLNSLGQGFWDYAAGVFIQASVLIVLLLIIDFMVRKRVRAVFRYCLWMLLFVKLVLPASFTLPTGIGYWLGDYFPSDVSIAKFVPQTEEAVPMVINIPQWYTFSETPTMNETVPTGIELESISWQGLVFSGWLVGILVLLAILVRRIYFIRGLIAKSRPANERSLEMLEECRCQIGIRRNIELRLTGNELSPAVCGLFKPIILIPSALLKKLSREKLKAVLTHELAHIKRGDGWVNLLQTMLQIVYFYNPLVWLANAMVRRVREQAVDEMVLVTLRPETKNYSNMLIDIAEMAFWRPNFGLRIIGVVESKKALERRINHMLTRPTPKSSKLGCLGLIAIVVIGAILLPMGRNSMAEAAETKTIVPGVRVGDYTFDMSRDDVLERLGKPKAIFHGDNRYTLDNLPKKYFMHYGDVSFGMTGDSVTGITALSPSYKFANGLGVGDSAQKIKEVFGDDFSIREFARKDFLSYEDKGLMFEINKQNGTVIEINVSPVPGSESYTKADVPPTSTINEQGRIVDKTDYPFVNDQKVIGGWKSVDFVREIDQFDPTAKGWKGDLYLNHLVFEEGGNITGKILTWTKGLVLSDDTASKYIIKEIGGSTYMFFEWKSGDYTIRHMKPFYYVLKKVSAKSLKHEPMFGKKADIPPTSYINEQGRLVDKTDYPFVNDQKVIGGWKSVDFVREIKQFNPAKKNWRGGLHLNHLIFEEGGAMPHSSHKWTKGLVLDDDTASKYIIKEIEGSSYMFYEWKSGDYTIRYMKPSYYVLKKVSTESVKYEPMYGRKAYIPPTSTINEEGRIVDKIDYPFVNDPRLIGTWKSVDFVGEMEKFKAGKKQWGGGELYLKGLIFKPNGRTFKPWWTWTKGLVFHSGDKTASKYTIKDIEGSTYMFYEWKSGDYTIRYRKPSYYVFKKVSSKTSGPLDKVWISKQEDDEDEIMVGGKSHIPPTSTFNEKGHIVDKIDWPFINDSKVIGAWKSVDFVGEIKQFKVDEQQWKGRGGELFLNEMIFGKNGRLISKNDKVPRGYPGTWTKGLVIYDNDTKTASKYTIKEIDGSAYMFYEWKSGDYTFRHRKPSYYVLKKVSSETAGLADAWVAPRKGLLGLELNDRRWPLVDVVPGMPAAKAGLQNGDKILTVNSKDITHITTIRDALAVLHGDPGEKVKLTVQRGEQVLTFEVERSKGQQG